jgi:predicted acylesterase/phospholipase RssA
MRNCESELAQEAKRTLNDEAASAQRLSELGQGLTENERNFGLARRLLTRAREIEPHNTRLRQKLALATYKDADLPVGKRLDDALTILGDGDDLATTTDQESLGLAGAIFKRKWEADAQKSHLERSATFYLRGYEQGVDRDHGYTAINAAFTLDLLADLEDSQAREVGADSVIAEDRRRQAQVIRREILRVLTGLREQNPVLDNDWWFLATLAEACFGLGRYRDAQPELMKGKALHSPAWERESTVRQLASIVRLREVNLRTPAELELCDGGQVLREYLGDDAQGVFSAFAGKMGLGLSGGGFRASFFHIGVLARMAELDLLRHVEVLSCVSGGSILGAHYYLKLARVLRAKPDREIGRADYVDVVREMITEFLEGVQTNIRTRVAAELWTNFKMVMPNYTRTVRIGELYERQIYSRIEDRTTRGRRYLQDLEVTPPGSTDFNPKDDNWTRRAKVPILLINATTLNTGHNWQFAASWMGEPPAAIDTEIDASPWLRRMYYCEAPEEHQDFPLGSAVAASSCVPGLFAPLALSGLYDRRTVRLVDGGVHDNQGNVGLLEQGCSVVVVSDAGGQLAPSASPSEGIVGVLLRSQGIQNARIREAQHRDLQGRKTGSLLKSLAFLHMRSGLEEESVGWVGSDEPQPTSGGLRTSAEAGDLTPYDVRRDVQELVAGIRTDLDSFSEVEAFALMNSGYKIAVHALGRDLPGLGTEPAEAEDWPFLVVDDAMRGNAATDDLKRILKVGRSRAFKVWMLSRPLKVAGGLLAVLLAAAALWGLWALREASLPLLWIVVIPLVLAALSFLAPLVLSQGMVRLLRVRDVLTKAAVGIVMGTVGWIGAVIHLLVFDRMFLRMGRVDRLPGERPKPQNG